VGFLPHVSKGESGFFGLPAGITLRDYLPYGYRDIVDAFEEDSPCYITVEVTDRLVRNAGYLSVSRALRGYDALHLASALSLRERVHSSLMFVPFDRELSIAAKREELRIHPLGA
jgi:hypothetical protein